MLTYIDIKNFTIIKQIELDFQNGMTVLTGETGAGKSIIVDTLELILGGRADNSVIRHGADKCEITAIFDLSEYNEALQWLIEQEMDNEDECIIRRSINADGRSRISINGVQCPLLQVREFGSMLLNIHGQHEHQGLLKVEKQRDFLDAFAENQSLCQKVKQIYYEWLNAKKGLITLQDLAENRSAKLELLSYQQNELEKLALKDGELEALHNEHSMLSNAEELIANSNAIIDLTSENENSILANLNLVKNYLEKIAHKDSRISPALELFNSAIIQANEAIAEVKKYLASVELNQERLHEVEMRLNNIYDLARKHKVKPEKLYEVYQTIKNQLQQVEIADIELQKIQQKIDILENDYKIIAGELSLNRKEAGEKLNKLVTEKMQLLGMNGGKFAVKFESNQDANDLNPHGLEKIEFYVSTNSGQPFAPLAKVVSGGELSRISLAIQVITAEKKLTPILIFDEVDVGIGGKTAEIVGEMLKKIGNNAQVICITHLPQVASKGDFHLKVAKENAANDVEVNITTLNKNERINEIARMLGGINITESTLKVAKEMLSERN